MTEANNEGRGRAAQRESDILESAQTLENERPLAFLQKALAQAREDLRGTDDLDKIAELNIEVATYEKAIELKKQTG